MTQHIIDPIEWDDADGPTGSITWHVDFTKLPPIQEGDTLYLRGPRGEVGGDPPPDFDMNGLADELLNPKGA